MGPTETAASLLAKLITVDGAGSALDADLLDGQHGSYYATQASQTAQDTLIAAKLDAATAATTYVDVGGDTMTGKLNLLPSASGGAGLGLGSGAAPSSPVDGDIWATTAGLGVRFNGTSYSAAMLNGSSTFTGTKTFSVPPIMATPAAGQASIRLPPGVAPSAPVNGDIWATTTGVYARVNGVTLDMTNQGIGEAPNDGQQYARQSLNWAAVTIPPGLTMSDAPPASPQPGQLWYETDTGALYAWYADGTSSQWIQIAGPTTAPEIAPMAQCYLTTSGANLLLQRENGNKLLINGRNETIPAAGVTLAPTGLAAATTYWIYAAMVAGVMVLEASTTAPAAADATYGFRFKTGDASRTFVGGWRSAAAGAWDADRCRGASWFNPKAKSSFAGNISPTTTSNGWVELSTSLRVDCMCLLGREVRATFQYTAQCSVATADTYTTIGIDGVNGILPNMRPARPSGTAGQEQMPSCITGYLLPSEGLHFFTGLGYVSATNTGTWATAWMECTIQG